MKSVGRLVVLAMMVTCSATAEMPVVDTEELCKEADHYLSYPLDSLVSVANLPDITLVDELMALSDLFDIVDATRL